MDWTGVWWVKRCGRIFPASTLSCSLAVDWSNAKDGSVGIGSVFLLLAVVTGSVFLSLGAAVSPWTVDICFKRRKNVLKGRERGGGSADQWRNLVFGGGCLLFFGVKG